VVVIAICDEVAERSVPFLTSLYLKWNFPDPLAKKAGDAKQEGRPFK
jgi:hypothetical protein